MSATATHTTTDEALSAVVYKLDCLERVLQKILGALDAEPNYDQTYVVGGNVSAAAVYALQIPRTVIHIELEVSGSIAQEFAVFCGNVTLSDAQNRHGHTASATPQQSNAEVVSSGGKVKVRTYTNRDGYVTVFFPAAYNGYVNIRIRDLDKSQAHALRT